MYTCEDLPGTTIQDPLDIASCVFVLGTPPSQSWDISFRVVCLMEVPRKSWDTPFRILQTLFLMLCVLGMSQEDYDPLEYDPLDIASLVVCLRTILEPPFGHCFSCVYLRDVQRQSWDYLSGYPDIASRMHVYALGHPTPRQP